MRKACFSTDVTNSVYIYYSRVCLAYLPEEYLHKYHVEEQCVKLFRQLYVKDRKTDMEPSEALTQQAFLIKQF